MKTALKRVATTGAVAGAFAIGALINWEGGAALDRAGDIVEWLVEHVEALERQIGGGGTDQDGLPIDPENPGLEGSDNHHREQLRLANEDALRLENRVQKAIENIDGIEW